MDVSNSTFRIGIQPNGLAKGVDGRCDRTVAVFTKMLLDFSDLDFEFDPLVTFVKPVRGAGNCRL